MMLLNDFEVWDLGEAASNHFKVEVQRLRRLSRFSYYLISIDRYAQNAVIADWAVIPNGISFLPSSSFVLSFSVEDLHTVYDGVYDHLHSPSSSS
jgi:hypothetical protein